MNKYRILIESHYSSLPFNGFVPLHKGVGITVWESYKRYNLNDANNYLERLYAKHPEAIYNSTIEPIGD